MKMNVNRKIKSWQGTAEGEMKGKTVLKRHSII